MKNNISKLETLFGKFPVEVLTMLMNSTFSLEHPIYHPEKYLFNHIDIVCGRALQWKGRYRNELLFAALLHDITKHGYLTLLGEENRVGELREIPEGKYWRNTDHPKSAVEFISLQNVKKWVSNFADVDIVISVVENHMKMKMYLEGEVGNDNGMSPKKMKKMKEKYTKEGIWDIMYYFSSYCDKMLVSERSE